MARKHHIFAACIGASFAVPALAAPVALPGSVRPLSAQEHVVGPADPNAIIHFQVALQLRDQATLASNPQVMSPAEFEAAHLPLQADHDAVVAWLTKAGISVDETSPARLTIYASGREALVASVLGVHFSTIMANGVSYVSADSAPSVPQALAGIILSINGLQPQLRVHSLAMRPQANVSAVPFLPSDFKNAYLANNLGAGAGTITAIVIDTAPSLSDLATYYKRAGVAGSTSNITIVNVNNAQPLAAAYDEPTLDVQIASGIAPSSKIRVYASGTLTTSALDKSFQKIINDLKAGIKITQVSISLGECESDVPKGLASTENGYFATMESLGATVFVSSGDQGSATCGSGSKVPSFYATSPNVTAVGGTTLTMAGSAEKSETAWSGSTGGYSAYFGKPAYQSKISGAWRAVPDIAADANPNSGALIVLDGASTVVGGTSLSAPLCAGLVAIVNGQRLAAGKKPLGQINTNLYPHVSTASFRDITTGSNGAYSASIGYDVVTGLGAPLLKTLSPILVALP